MNKIQALQWAEYLTKLVKDIDSTEESINNVKASMKDSEQLLLSMNKMDPHPSQFNVRVSTTVTTRIKKTTLEYLESKLDKLQNELDGCMMIQADGYR